MDVGNILDTDSYKFSHFLQYPPGMTSMTSYLESRGGEFTRSTLFGLQYLLHRYLAEPVTNDQLNYAGGLAQEHGEPFNAAGWRHIIDRYEGRLPITIRAIREGTSVPTRNVLLTVSCDDPACFWVVNWLETALSRVWYPSTIAVASSELRDVWWRFLVATADDPLAEVAFKHHDFGSRGVTCQEQAMLGGAAHLLSFSGTDTLAAVEFAHRYYDEPMAGFSIPATEHSTMTVWGQDGESAAIRNWVKRTLVERSVPSGAPKLSACVGDSYDIIAFVRQVCSPDVIKDIQDSGGTLVIRPDSGDPFKVLPDVLGTLEACLPTGSVRANTKGYKLLPSYIRTIWGDGINRRTAPQILKHVTDMRWSASNVAFGSGGGLLQDVDRDTQRFAFKCCSAVVDGAEVNVSKKPSTDTAKSSKAGRLDLIRLDDGSFRTIALPCGTGSDPRTEMVTVFDDGDITYHSTFFDVKRRLLGAT